MVNNNFSVGDIEIMCGIYPDKYFVFLWENSKVGRLAKYVTHMG